MAPRHRFLLDSDDEISYPILSHLTGTELVVVANTSANADAERAVPADEQGTTTTTTTTTDGESFKSRPAPPVSTAPPTPPRHKSVSFHLVHVREYGRVVGDHPEVKVGPPIALSWQFVTNSPVLIEAYERDRKLDDNTSRRRGRTSDGSRSMDRLTSIARKNLLLEYGFTEADFRSAEWDANLVREQRSMTKQEFKQEKVMSNNSKADWDNDDNRSTTKLHKRIGRSFRKNFLSSLSAAAKAMATPTMMIPV